MESGTMLKRTISLIAIALTLGLGSPQPSAEAHLAKWGSWEITHRNLMKLFPDADPNAWRIKRYTYGTEEVAFLEKELGFELYPEDKQPEFFVAQDASGKLLGVAIFIDPRTKPKILNGGILTLEVGIGVDAAGKINRIRVYDYRGNVELTKETFLNQLQQRTLGDNFAMDGRDLKAVEGEPEESQLVANAAREALLLMKVALGRR
ncbi:MAG: hypothetical protein KC420_00615 [Myxococcales bacterium]|nr:hypothetical protein [Myxococcales bacterium]MCB9566817.1 hypothetical protein [Myxococcales bacterium]MCB9704551.1 hypothetical protein [Myxococcales bacterium]